MNPLSLLLDPRSMRQLKVTTQWLSHGMYFDSIAKLDIIARVARPDDDFVDVQVAQGCGHSSLQKNVSWKSHDQICNMNTNEIFF